MRFRGCRDPFPPPFFYGRSGGSWPACCSLSSRSHVRGDIFPQSGPSPRSPGLLIGGKFDRGVILLDVAACFSVHCGGVTAGSLSPGDWSPVADPDLLLIL